MCKPTFWRNVRFGRHTVQTGISLNIVSLEEMPEGNGQAGNVGRRYFGGAPE